MSSIHGPLRSNPPMSSDANPCDAAADADTLAASVSRRRAAQRLAIAAVSWCADWPALAAPLNRGTDHARIARTFTVFADTLVPADALTPSASALGVAAAILDAVRGNSLAERLVGVGCAWLDTACSGDFSAATEGARVVALERMQTLPWESPAGRFYQVMRNSVMTDYYAQPASWRGLALDRPPQPLGFFDAVR